jgi:hypothetical protein
MYRHMIRQVPCSGCATSLPTTQAHLCGVGTGFQCGRCALVAEIGVHLDRTGIGLLRGPVMAVTMSLWALTAAGLGMAGAAFWLS